MKYLAYELSQNFITTESYPHETCQKYAVEALKFLQDLIKNLHP